MILVKTMAGSHLFGLNTENSDKDYKGVYLPSKEEILLANYKPTLMESTGNNEGKNSKDDVDVELYSLPKFFKMLRNGDTAAIELIFTPEDCIIEKSPEWDEILKYRDQLISKKISAMIGYARQQAAKYGVKGSRMGELAQVIDKLREVEKKFDFPKAKMKLAWEELCESFKHMKHVHEITLEMKTIEEDRKIPAFDVLGKKFDYHCTFQHVLQHLSRVYKDYGYRAREARKNNGIDWKALSHALRVMFQGQTLLTHGYIDLPHKGINRDILLKIKKGEMDFDTVSNLLESNMWLLEEFLECSDLQDEVSRDLTDKITLDMFERVVNGKL